MILEILNGIPSDAKAELLIIGLFLLCVAAAVYMWRAGSEGQSDLSSLSGVWWGTRCLSEQTSPLGMTSETPHSFVSSPVVPTFNEAPVTAKK
jgi:hypothetical protein